MIHLNCVNKSPLTTIDFDHLIHNPLFIIGIGYQKCIKTKKN